MAILSRFKDVMSSNINALLDKMEDPRKMIDQMLRDAMEDLAEVKKDTAAVMAEEQRCKRILDGINDEIAKYEGLAMKALQAGNEADATVFLQEKSRVSANLEGAQTTYNAARQSARRMRQMHDKLTNDINELRSRKESIKATMSVAETQKKINAMGGTNAQANLSKFDDYAAKAQQMLDQAEAEATLNTEPVCEADALAAKYSAQDDNISAELAAMKAKLGL